MKTTNIQWAHSTTNPVMGCDGCELWPGKAKIVAEMAQVILVAAGVAGCAAATDIRKTVDRVIGPRTSSEIYSDRKVIANNLAADLHLGSPDSEALENVVRGNMKCYAGLLGTMRKGHNGYATKFEKPKRFTGRMAIAANWDLPSPAERAAKPWLLNAPRMIFVSDMGDALSSKISFNFLKREVIENVISNEGSQHLWLWLTKRPKRMADFGNWLQEHGIAWPGNLVAMTTVTSQKTAYRVGQLRQVPSLLKGLSCEPLFGKLKLNLAGIHWVISGGGSDTLAGEYNVEWALDLHDQCRKTKTAFFIKQLGKNPVFNGMPVKLADRHGGNWNEWPDPRWRIRQIPMAFLPKPKHK